MVEENRGEDEALPHCLVMATCVRENTLMFTWADSLGMAQVAHVLENSIRFGIQKKQTFGPHHET